MWLTSNRRSLPRLNSWTSASMASPTLSHSPLDLGRGFGAGAASDSGCCFRCASKQSLTQDMPLLYLVSKRRLTLSLVPQVRVLFWTLTWAEEDSGRPRDDCLTAVPGLVYPSRLGSAGLQARV